MSERAGWPEPGAAGGGNGPAESADPWNGTEVAGPIGRSSLSTFASVGGEEESSNGRVCHPAAKIVRTSTEAHRATRIWSLEMCQGMPDQVLRVTDISSIKSSSRLVDCSLGAGGPVGGADCEGGGGAGAGLEVEVAGDAAREGATLGGWGVSCAAALERFFFLPLPFGVGV